MLVGTVICKVARDSLPNFWFLTSGDLHANLSRLQLLPRDPSRDVDRLLNTLVRQAYLDRQRTDAAATAASLATNREHEVDFEYRWGPRAKVEVKEEDIVRFVTEVGLDILSLFSFFFLVFVRILMGWWPKRGACVGVLRKEGMLVIYKSIGYRPL